MRRRSWSCLVAAGVVLSACSSDGNDGMGPSAVELGGPWAWQESVTFAALRMLCTDTGTVEVSQTGETFSASGSQAGTCSREGGPPQAFALDFALAAGVISGSAVTFSVDTCPYRGNASGDSIIGTISCIVDVDGRSVQATGTWRLVPPAPTVTATVAYPAADTLAVPGDVVGIRVHVEARRPLGWVGYALGAPMSRRDSVRVTGHEVEHQFDIVAPNQAGSAAITVFARDAGGGQSRPKIGNLVVMGNMIRRPTRSLVLTGHVREMVVDPRRNRVYLSQPDSMRVASVDLGTGAYGSTITTPFPSAGIDLTPGGDSLIFASASSTQIGIVNLAAAAPIVTTHVLASELASPDVVWVGDRVRALANNKVMVTLTYADRFSCCEGWLSEYDLSNGTTRLRTDAGPERGGTITNQVPLARAGDGGRMLMVTGWSSTTEARTYLSDTDTFSPLAHLVVSNAPYSVTADADGSHFLIANASVDADLQTAIPLAEDEYEQGGATILSPDGSTAYVAIYDGYLKLRLPDGAVVERVRLPRWAMAFAITSDGSTLIATSGTNLVFGPDERVLIVDLR